jgi:hypothetical protein
MGIWLIYLQNRWRGIAAGGVAILALVALALLGWGGPALGMRLLGNADAPRVVSNTVSGTVLPRSGDPNAPQQPLPDANASVLDTAAPINSGPQTVAEAQASWSADLLRLHQQAVLTQLNCARQAQRLPILALDAQLSQTAGSAWLRLAHDPTYSLMQLPGSYELRSVLPLRADNPVATTSCVAGEFDPEVVLLSGGATTVGIAVFPPQASWDMASAVVLAQ